MKRLLALGLLLGSVAASAQTVSVANGKWAYLPELERAGHADITPNAVIRIHQIVSKGDCSIPGQSRKRLNMTVPFAVQYAPDGTAQQILVQRLGCAEVEGILGGQVLELVKGREFRPTGANADGWYRGELNFSSS